MPLFTPQPPPPHTPPCQSVHKTLQIICFILQECILHLFPHAVLVKCIKVSGTKQHDAGVMFSCSSSWRHWWRFSNSLNCKFCFGSQSHHTQSKTGTSMPVFFCANIHEDLTCYPRPSWYFLFIVCLAASRGRHMVCWSVVTSVFCLSVFYVVQPDASGCSGGSF